MHSSLCDRRRFIRFRSPTRLTAGVNASDNLQPLEFSAQCPHQLTQRNVRRSSASRAYLGPAKGRSNLSVMTGAQVLRIVVEQGRPLAMSEPFMRDLMRREWRGNVRELRNIVIRLTTKHAGQLVDATQLQTELDMDGAAQEIDLTERQLHVLISELPTVAGKEEGTIG